MKKHLILAGMASFLMLSAFGQNKPEKMGATVKPNPKNNTSAMALAKDQIDKDCTALNAILKKDKNASGHSDLTCKIVREEADFVKNFGQTYAPCKTQCIQ
jgi:hypothetical protein